MKAITTIDATGNILMPQDRVYTYDPDGSKVLGRIYFKEDNPDGLEWCVLWDDGEDCIVLDFSEIWKVN